MKFEKLVKGLREATKYEYEPINLAKVVGSVTWSIWKNLYRKDDAGNRKIDVFKDPKELKAYFTNTILKDAFSTSEDKRYTYVSMIRDRITLKEVKDFIYSIYVSGVKYKKRKEIEDW
jgi:hypothetical protein